MHDIDEINSFIDRDRFLGENLMEEKIHGSRETRKSVLNVGKPSVVPLAGIPHGHGVKWRRLVNAFEVTRSF